MIRLAQVTKVLSPGTPQAHDAIRDLSLELRKHEITVFSGPSGSGKTTLLSLIGGMLRPTSGHIFLDGRDVAALPERFAARFRRKIFGMVFQRDHLIRGMSARDNVMVPGLPLGIPRRDLKQQASALLARFGLIDKADRHVDRLSGGERQRVVIARALINDPEILIADEPTAHLDTTLTDEFLDIIARLKADRKTILLSSHDPRVSASPIVDRVIPLQDGRLASPA